MKKLILIAILMMISGCTNTSQRLNISQANGFETYTTASYESMRITYNKNDIEAIKIIELLNGILELSEMKK